MKAGRFKQWTAGIAAMALPVLVFAQPPGNGPEPWQLNMRRGVTELSHSAYQAHMMALWICVGIGVLVFGAMAVAMFKFRKSKGAVADKDFTHSTKLEILWTVAPVVLLVLMAAPATTMLINNYDIRESEMTVKVTGYQWLWRYEYLGEGVAFTSRIAETSDIMRQSGKQPTLAENPHYLLNVDNMLVLPTQTKIRFVVTADDVIHSWWVPDLGWKQDAIPGIVNEAWTDIFQPGIYRGQCAELCGKDHGFMPIVVKAVPPAEFREWLAAQKAANAPVPAPVAPSEPAPVDNVPVEGSESTEAAAAAAAPQRAAVAGL